MSTIIAFISLKLYKVWNIYPRSIKSFWDSINGSKFNKGSLEFYNDQFVDNYESSLLDLVFKKYH